jgi:hypothetical protein
MTYPPGQGKSGPLLMELWRRYLEQLAEHEGNLEEQIAVGSYKAAEVLGFLTWKLDREGKYRHLIEQRQFLFAEGTRRAVSFEDRLLTATFTIYNHTNTLSHQFSTGIPSAEKLIRDVDEQVKQVVQEADQVERSAAAIKAAFPLFCLMTLLLNRGGGATDAIRTVQDRFAKGAGQASTSWEHLINAIYRSVETLQLIVSLSEPELKDQVLQIAARFQEEDQSRDIRLKLRNGFCRFFELSHLLAIHLDETIP